MNVIPVTSQEQFDDMLAQTTDSGSLCIPIWENGQASSHPATDRIVAVYITHSSNFNDLYVIGCGHPDLPAFDITPMFGRMYTSMMVDNKLAVLYHYNVASATDTYAEQFRTTTDIQTLMDFGSPFHKKMTSLLRTFPKCGLVIPIVKWTEAVIPYIAMMRGLRPQVVVEHFYNSVVTPTIQWIESAKLHVRPQLLKTWFLNAKVEEGDFVYSKYNLFNTTGRPSNSFGGINFLALSKTSGVRHAFDSRFGEDGRLVQFDFDSYHLRLLANHLNIDIGLGSIHQKLAEEYFGTDQITPEMYDEAKQVTFAILYGTETLSNNIPPFLKSIKAFEAELWEQYDRMGYLWGLKSYRRFVVPEASPSKVFNYFVQCLEFESTIQKLHNLRQRLSGMRSQVILYTYDAILIDCATEEAGAIKAICTEVLEEGGFPVKVSVGKTYNNMTQV